jgi:hypothetical protein
MLVNRLMGLADDGITPDHDNKIPVHAFFAAQSEVIRGALTVAQVKTFLNMDAATQAEYDTLVATAPTGNTATALANKALFIEKIPKNGIRNTQRPMKSEQNSESNYGG